MSCLHEVQQIHSRAIHRAWPLRAVGAGSKDNTTGRIDAILVRYKLLASWPACSFADAFCWVIFSSQICRLQEGLACGQDQRAARQLSFKLLSEHWVAACRLKILRLDLGNISDAACSVRTVSSSYLAMHWAMLMVWIENNVQDDDNILELKPSLI